MSLVLTIKKDEYITVTGRATFTFVEVTGNNQIRVAVDAPKEVKIQRSSYKRKDHEKLEPLKKVKNEPGI